MNIHNKEKSGELLEALLSSKGNQQPSSLNLQEKVGEKVQRLIGEEVEANNPNTSARHLKKDDDIVSSVSIVKMQKRRIKSLCDKNMEDYGDLTDVENGYDFVIDKEPGDMGFPSYKKSKPRRNPSPLFESDDVINDVLTNIKNLNKEVEYKSYNDLKEALDHVISSEVDGVTVESKPAASTKSAPVVEEEEVDDDDLRDFEKELLAGIKD